MLRVGFSTQPDAQLPEVQPVVTVPVVSAQALQPVLEIAPTKNEPAVNWAWAAVQPPVARVWTSPPRQTCQPAAHRSTDAQPVPTALDALLLPVVAQPAPAECDGAGNTPGRVQPPAHAAMLGNVVWLAKASRVPSAQPTGEIDAMEVHTPPAQTCDGVHALPHVPQLFASLPVMAHEPPHNVEPVGHEPDEHPPAMQTWPIGQAFPHVPQFKESAVRLVHVVPQTD